MIVKYCPRCRSEALERCLRATRALPGWSDHCRRCGWRGHAPHYRDGRPYRGASVDREPFADWPDGQGE